MINAPHGSEGETIYPGTCRDLTPTERAERIGAGTSPLLEPWIARRAIDLTGTAGV